jgi:hypothetical protein
MSKIFYKKSLPSTQAIIITWLPNFLKILASSFQEITWPAKFALLPNNIASFSQNSETLFSEPWNFACFLLIY